MARLNDPPAPPPESIDALKRRFIRQNREIARANANQSQRIRNLEIEISRIAADNLTLRCEVIAAQAEAERWRQANIVNRDLLEWKGRMEQALKETFSLVSEVPQILEKAATSRSRKSGVEKLKTTSEAEWKTRSAMREALAKEKNDGLDGRLPGIVEGKLYPRRTLEPADVIALRDEATAQDSTESPDLGPPPVAHFDVQDPIKFDTSRQSEQASADDVSQLPSTLERRRRRRTSALLQDMSKEEDSVVEQPVETTTSPLLKAGAKRKLDASELEEPTRRQSSESEEFVFQRRQDQAGGLAGGRKSSRFARPPGRENDLVNINPTLSPQKNVAGRKILAPKTTNSPAKRKVQLVEKVEALDDSRKDDIRQIAKPSRKIKLPPALEKLESSYIPVRDERDDLQPKTPAALSEDILSPVSTEPSVRNTHQTKSEAAVLDSVEDVLNGSIGRGSRRARPAISYAEPSLRDKMRRPGKELVGAVEGLDKQRETTSSHSRGTSLDPGRFEGENENQVRLPANFKQERNPLSDNRWKELPLTSKKEEPASPLRDKERKEKIREKPSHSSSRTETASVPNDNARTPSSSSMPAPNLINNDGLYAEDLKNAVERLSIFDPPVSSPLEDSKEYNDKDAAKAVQAATSSRRRVSNNATPSANLLSRRHSMQPSSSLSSSNPSDPPISSHSRTSQSGTNAPAPPRPSSAASLHNHAPTSTGANNGLKRSASSSAMSSTRHARGGAGSGSTGGSSRQQEPLASTAGAGSEDTRGERTAMTRRRSLMV
ncbi:hypothetical protein LTR84_002015 [Exophiala bonariae]|uniref:Shugoshin C-terminal domain-containing protein n=1 Tax=Exophiala bonariae TaxID=1690606 RepID=A0AAV9NA28_9EURO|nr:hypothetical protein LTR84_002015 [Exophiala bonariae]